MAAVTQDAVPPLSPTQEVLVNMVQEPVLKLGASPQDAAVLREVERVIIYVLDLTEDDEQVLHAADRLYDAAIALQDIWDKRSRSRRITDEAVASRAEALDRALVHFGVSISRAKPNSKGWTWRPDW